MTNIVLRCLCVLIAAAGIGTPSWLVAHHSGSAERDIAYLQTLASQACACARSTIHPSSHVECWSQFNKRVRKTYGRGATTCYPLSEESVTVLDNAPADQARIITAYHVVSSNAPDLCSKEEAIEGEAIWQQAFGPVYPQGDAEMNAANRRAAAALDAFARKLASDQPLRKVIPAMGCVTGFP
jgi:hypothetical protein